MESPLLLGQTGQRKPELLGPWEDIEARATIPMGSWDDIQIWTDALSHVSSAGTKAPSNQGEEVGGGGSNVRG